MSAGTPSAGGMSLERLDLEAIEARATAATPGLHGGGFVADACFLHDRQGRAYVRFQGPNAEWDCSFFQHARADVPALVAEVRRLSAALEERTRERDEAREIVSRVNNEVIGSLGYFTTPSCVEAIWKLKDHARRTGAAFATTREALEAIAQLTEIGHMQWDIRYSRWASLKGEDDIAETIAADTLRTLSTLHPTEEDRG